MLENQTDRNIRTMLAVTQFSGPFSTLPLGSEINEADGHQTLVTDDSQECSALAWGGKGFPLSTHSLQSELERARTHVHVHHVHQNPCSKCLTGKCGSNEGLQDQREIIFKGCECLMNSIFFYHGKNKRKIPLSVLIHKG